MSIYYLLIFQTEWFYPSLIASYTFLPHSLQQFQKCTTLKFAVSINTNKFIRVIYSQDGLDQFADLTANQSFYSQFSFLSDQLIKLRHTEATQSLTQRNVLEHTSGGRNEEQRCLLWWPLDWISPSLKLHSGTAKITRKKLASLIPHIPDLICSPVF